MSTLLSTRVGFQSLSRVWLFAIPLEGSPPGSSVHGFSRQEYWSGLPFPPPGKLPNQGIKPMPPVSPALQVYSLPLSHWGSLLSTQLCLLNTYLTEFNWYHPSEIKTPMKVGLSSLHCLHTELLRSHIMLCTREAVQGTWPMPSGGHPEARVRYLSL